MSEGEEEEEEEGEEEGEEELALEMMVPQVGMGGCWWHSIAKGEVRKTFWLAGEQSLYCSTALLYCPT